MYFATGRVECEKRRSVDFRKFELLSRFRRPFNPECVAVKCGRIAVAFKGPPCDRFPALLFHGAKLGERSGGLKSSFLFKFAFGGGQWLFVLPQLTFWQKPRAFIFLCPERTARMD